VAGIATQPDLSRPAFAEYESIIHIRRTRQVIDAYKFCFIIQLVLIKITHNGSLYLPAFGDRERKTRHKE
jgi:hypothetical protein